jgi:uncharacterized protein (TIGR03086 family)
VTAATGRTHHHALDLLERALGYTRVALATVGPDRSVPTPCAGWSLADLLCHMDDGLDAFLEAAGGAVRVEVPRAAGADLSLLQHKACRLLAVWQAQSPPMVVVGDRELPAGLLVAAAALEITVHGWDVAQATRTSHDIPEEHARALMPVAHAVVTPDDRAERFAAPIRTPPEATSAQVLLGYLGRG